MLYALWSCDVRLTKSSCRQKADDPDATIVNLRERAPTAAVKEIVFNVQIVFTSYIIAMPLRRHRTYQQAP